MYECWNCGEPPDTCMCIPWCYKHGRRDIEPRCQQCAVERAAEEKRELARRVQRRAVWRHRWEEFCKLFG